MPERDPADDFGDRLEVEYRLARMEARWESRGTVLAGLVLVAILALALYNSGVLKLDLAALSG